MTTTVLVTGASGYLALHIVKQLLDGGYKVVGSVRTTAKGEKLAKDLNNKNFKFDIVDDLENKEAIVNFVKNNSEATALLHTASPFRFDVNDVQKDLIDPAVKGTEAVLDAVKQYGPQIKNVVITSSYAAIMNLKKTDKSIDTEESWNPITPEEALLNSFYAYVASKTFAEKAAWDFVKDQKPGFDLSTVNPVYIFGPQPFDDFDTTKLNTSCEIINSFTKLKDPSADFQKVYGLAIDVRDVAKAHIVAIEKDEAKGQRLFLTNGFFNEQTILDVLHTKFKDEAQSVPVGHPASDKEAAKDGPQANNDKTKKILGFKFISVEQSIADTAQQIYEVEAKHNESLGRDEGSNNLPRKIDTDLK